MRGRTLRCADTLGSSGRHLSGTVDDVRWDLAAGALMCAGAGLDVRPLADTADQPSGLLVAPPALTGALLALVGP